MTQIIKKQPIKIYKHDCIAVKIFRAPYKYKTAALC